MTGPGRSKTWSLPFTQRLPARDVVPGGPEDRDLSNLSGISGISGISGKRQRLVGRERAAVGAEAFEEPAKLRQLDARRQQAGLAAEIQDELTGAFLAEAGEVHVRDPHAVEARQVGGEEGHPLRLVRLGLAGPAVGRGGVDQGQEIEPLSPSANWRAIS